MFRLSGLGQVLQVWACDSVPTPIHLHILMIVELQVKEMEHSNSLLGVKCR